MDNYYQITTNTINNMKSGELLYRYCFYDNFVSSKKLKELTTRTGNKIEDDYNKCELMFLAQKIHGQVHILGTRLTYYHIKAVLKNEGRKKLTKTKQRWIKGMVMYHCLKIDDNEKCLKCGKDRIEIKVRKNYMKMIGKKMIPDSSVKILKCGCGEFLKVKQEAKGIYGNRYTKKL
jgi:hypothetical protein